ncbi:MAG: ABC transporter permease [Solirubrobacteraceae bacterium]|nr:ABC transporter permease [Patulibacter sp.]
MTLRETLRIAFGGILANKLRSALTILGMTIGVSAVIVLVAVGNGSKEQVQSQIQALGTNVLTVSSATSRFGPGGGAQTSSASLTLDDVKALENKQIAPDILSVAPVVTATSATLTSGSTSYSPSSSIGTTPAYLAASNYSIASGEMFTAADVTNGADVVVLGPTVASNLGASVGSSIETGGRTLTVVGITKAKGTSGTTDSDDIIFMPYTTMQAALAGYGSISSIKVQATSEKAINLAQAEVEEILNLRHPASASSTATSAATGGTAGASSTNSSFQILNQASLLATSSSTTSVFTTLLGAVAAISLLVGGIGVMNIMLVSVTERTREIGIRKAIGARRSDILTQFLTEAVLVSTFGGLLGVAIGLGVSTFQIAGVQPAVAIGSVGLAFGASVLCGLFFGTYPAARAAALRPIDALRFE